MLTRRSLLQTSIAAAGTIAVFGSGATAAAAHHGALVWSDTFDRPDGPPGNGWQATGEWLLVAGAVESPQLAGARVLVQTGLELGPTFSVTATVRPLQPNYWSGVAVNLTENPDGGFDYYAFRIVTRSDGRPPSWQLLQVTGSRIDVLQSGGVAVAAGQDYLLTIASDSYGVLRLAIEHGGTSLLSSAFVVPLAALQAGGRVALYTDSGNLRVDAVEVSTVHRDATPPSPGPLQYTEFDGPHYTLPTSGETVSDVSVVDQTWSGHPVGQNVLTEGDTQYVCYYDAERTMTVASRTIGTDDWVRQPLDSVVGWDSHNYVTMALDAAGHLHVSGNMHVVPLVYFRTSTPGDVTTLSRVAPMVDPATETRVTYPTFLRDGDGALIFRYRDGVSGAGVDLYNIYDTTTQQWTRLLDEPLHNGEGLRNAYVAGPVLGPDGNYHIAWVWRDSGDAATNQRLSYARSADLVEWETSDGAALVPPITFDTGEIVDDVPMNGGIINGNTKIGFDPAGRVLISYHKYDDDGNTQVYIARRSAGCWRSRQISDWVGRWTIGGFGSLIFDVTLTAPEVLPDGNIRLDYTLLGHARTWVLSPGLTVLAEVDTPGLPAEITTLRSTFTGMSVRSPLDLGASTDGRYVLRWEARASNQDQPWPEPWPAAGPLEVYHLTT